VGLFKSEPDWTTRGGAWYFAPMLPHALVVLCHPNTSGFNQAVAEAAVKALSSTYEVALVDLYRSGFDPVLPYNEIPRKFSFDPKTLELMELVKKSQFFVFVHPDWWGGPPALLKGFIDRVFRPGVAYEFDGYEFLNNQKRALLEGRKAAVFTTTDYPEPEGTYPPQEIWRTNVLAYCGITNPGLHTFFGTYQSSYEARHAWIGSVGAKLAAL